MDWIHGARIFYCKRAFAAAKWPRLGGQLLRVWVESPILWAKDADVSVSHCHICNILMPPPWPPQYRPDWPDRQMFLIKASCRERLGRGLLYSCHWEARAWRAASIGPRVIFIISVISDLNVPLSCISCPASAATHSSMAKQWDRHQHIFIPLGVGVILFIPQKIF